MSRFAQVLLRSVIAGVFALFMGLSVTAPAAAQGTGNHFMDCLGWMFSDPAKHAAECSPGHDWTGPFTHAWGYQGPKAPTPSCTPYPTLPLSYAGSEYEPRLIQAAYCCPLASSFDGGQTNPMLLQVITCCETVGVDEPIPDQFNEPELLQAACED